MLPIALRRICSTRAVMWEWRQRLDYLHAACRVLRRAVSRAHSPSRKLSGDWRTSEIVMTVVASTGASDAFVPDVAEALRAG